MSDNPAHPKRFFTIDGHTHAWDGGDLNVLRDRLTFLDGPLEKSDPHKWFLRFEGTIEGLLAAEKAAGVDRFVLLPISSRPDRCRELTRRAAELAVRHSEIIPFGSLHPNSSTISEDVAEIRSLNLAGVKLHSLVQRFNPLSPSAWTLYEALAENESVVLFDSMSLSGAMRVKPHLAPFVEPALELGFETGPEQIALVAESFPRLKIIAAHMGCCYGWNRLDPLYALDNVYFDLAYVHRLLTPDEALAIIRRKGPQRIVFGTDAPWRSPKNALAWFLSLPLSEAEQAAVLAGNLHNLLNLTP